jgi:serine protease Do
MKYILATILLCFSISVSAEELTHRQLIGNLLNSTVKIATFTDDGRASGSGVIMHSSGLILTNYHVVHNSNRLKVWLYENRDKQYHEAEVIGIDPAADLALLNIDVKKDDFFTVSDFEYNGNVVYAGTNVIAVGHPLSLNWSVSKGAINAVNRPSFLTPYVSLIQHDAVIQQGSSGGPLFNDQGNLIGINTYVIAPLEKDVAVYAGMGYAVQGDDVYTSFVKMLSDGNPVGLRPAMRLDIINLNEDTTTSIREQHPDVYIPNTFGLISNKIDPDSHAASQGLKDFDVIVAMDGYPVNTMTELSNYLKDNKSPGDTVYLTILRQKEFIIVPYVLMDLEVPASFYDKDRPDKR